ncbi:MAG TPA: ATP-binding protein [Kofleriaceae bacterium]|nr:ATP-binding protein [Kofleriaceae bacterium]
MRVGARITAATSVLLALTLGAYALIDLRAAASERRETLEHQTRDMARTVRAGLHARGATWALDNARTISDELTKASGPWRISILPRSLLGKPPDSPQMAKSLERFRGLVEVRLPQSIDDDDHEYAYILPLAVPSLDTPDGLEVQGAIEVVRSTAHLDTANRADIRRSLLLLAIIIGFTVLAIVLLTRTVISRPIDKLIAGIDDVTKGDLSHVVLSERDDEIGDLAARFTEMTGSLRESRAETDRQNRARLALEQRLSQTEKLATLGQIAAEIAHEVGTPLNVIAGRARTLGKKAGDAEAVEKNARIIAEQTARITRIIQRLLDFTRRTVGTPEAVDVNLNEVTLTTMDFLENKFVAAHIKTSLDRFEGLPPVRGEPDRLQQVLLNLVLNAVQAMPNGGRLRVTTSLVSQRRPGLEREPEHAYVVVEVADTGAGIPAELRDKIFEPFYTSKDGEGGTGLGLAVCHGIVKEHDGWIEIDDAAPDDGAGTGAIFRVFLPTVARSTQ